jgi:acyl carrier protein
MMSDGSVLSTIEEWLERQEVEHATLDSLGVDSFGLVMLVLELESTFDVVLEDVVQAADPFRMTVGRLAREVERRISNGHD